MSPSASLPETGGSTAVILRSNDICHLGIVRALKAAGVRTVAAVFDYPGAPDWLSDATAAADRTVRIPNPGADEAGAVAALEQLGIEEGADGRRPMLWASSDTGLVLFGRNEERLGKRFRFLGEEPDGRVPWRTLDKGRTAAILDAAGVGQPLTLACSTSGEIPAVAAAMRYPCVYKPAVKDLTQSFYRGHGGLKAVTCADARELSERLPAEIAAGHRLVVQELVEYEGVEAEVPFYAYVDRCHRIRMALTACKERVEPPGFGTATVLRITWHPELLEAAQTIATALAWHGPLMIEFTRDMRTGAWQVIEINGRPWLLNDFYRRAGFDFVGMIYREHELPDGLMVPSPALLARRPVMVDMPAELAAMRRHGEAVDQPVMDRRLAGIGGDIYFSYDDPDDPGPGRACRQAIKQRYGVIYPPSFDDMGVAADAGGNNNQPGLDQPLRREMV
ncbi:carboxylate--amine ligase [Indioceanicola profundi]|uniref:carboxylate--amine ligase n=1 Tax=Indioceanicola profundi TaxID=2220096 RepID=UPI000E6ABE7E|nr:hypothetical protein [Indioceanicola profundi]